MPLPALVGLPWLAGVIVSAFVSFFTWLATFATKRLALVGIAVTAIIALTAALFIALEALVSTLNVTVPTEIAAGVSLLMPSNMTVCISILVTARGLRYAYDWNTRIVQLKLF